MSSITVALRRCGTDQPSTADRRRLNEFEETFFREIPEAQLDVTIPVCFIHILDENGNGAISAQQRAEQIKVLNRAYQRHGIRFSFEEAQTVQVSNGQFFKLGHKSAAERQCKQQHQALAPQKGLNFYTAGPAGGILGWATFPYEMEGDPAMDGVVMLHSTLPGGANAPYNLGATAVHEIGHWLGLYHTFQDGCFGDGDEVADTQPHSAPNFGKPSDDEQPHNLCPTAPAGTKCPIHNFMNYVDDDWMNEFTRGQITRVFAQLGMFRAELLGGTNVESSDLRSRLRW